MMKKFERPEMEVIVFAKEDIITNSSCHPDCIQICDPNCQRVD